MQCTGDETSESGSNGIFGWQHPVNVAEAPTGETLPKPRKSPAAKPSVNTHRHSPRTLAILNGTCVTLGPILVCKARKN